MQVLLVATNEHDKPFGIADADTGPMLPVVNRPVMAVLVEILARAGCKQIVVSLYQRGGGVAAYFGAGRRWGVQLDYVAQREAWGDAGAVRWVSRLVRETLLVLPADIILDLDIEAALAAHQAHGSGLTLITAPPRPQQPGRLIQRSAAGSVALAEPQPGAPAEAYTGAFIIEPALIQQIPARTPYDSYRQLLPELLAAGHTVHAYCTAGYWNQLNSAAAYHEAQRVFLYSAYQPPDLATNSAHAQLPCVRYPSIEGNQIAPGIWVGQNHMIHPDARLAAPVCIGEGCRVGANVELGPEAVIGAGVMIDDEATVLRSVILPRTYIGQLVNIQGRLVQRSTMIDLSTGERAEVTDQFLLAGITPLVLPKRQLRQLVSVGLAVLLLVLLAPLLLLIGAAVALASGGQVLARTPQVGRRASAQGAVSEPHTFDLLAFQTRRPNGTIHAFGRWLQALELSRLPELWNIVRGDMLFVGVKPLAPHEAAYLHEAWQQKRNDYPAGIVGLWYVQTTPESDLEAVLIADAYYTATRSWQGDLALLARAPLIWLRRVYGRVIQRLTPGEYLEHVDTVSGM